MSNPRSTQIFIQNNTGLELDLATESLSPGLWQTSPPSTIPDTQSASFLAVSDVTNNGDTGKFTYNSAAGPFTFNFTNPNEGKDVYNQSAPANYTSTPVGGGGDNAQITWILGKYPSWLCCIVERQTHFSFREGRIVPSRKHAGRDSIVVRFVIEDMRQARWSSFRQHDSEFHKLNLHFTIRVRVNDFECESSRQH